MAIRKVQAGNYRRVAADHPGTTYRRQEAAAPPEKKSILRAILRVLFGLNGILLGAIQMAPPLAEPLAGDHPMTIALSALYIYAVWAFVTNRHGRFFKLPF